MPLSRRESDHEVLEVQLPDRSYAIRIGERLLDRTGSFSLEAGLKPGRCALVTDSHVAPLYAPQVETSLRQAGFEPVTVTVPAGEPSKSMPRTEALCDAFAEAGLDRSSFVVALGGGVVGDLAGFAAAIFGRGIPVVQIPTTVVSQVDSSVGGKTGVNLSRGKNLVGCFHQPRLVLADVSTLESLPGREYREGFAEIIKHAMIRDAAMLDEVLAFRDSPRGIAPLIARNVALKARIVEADETETTGTRALLNFGHTIGHGIEAAAGYGELLHGEAISLGMVAALRLSERYAGLDPQTSARVIRLLEGFSLPTRLDATCRAAAILAPLRRDKKFLGGQIRFVLASCAGQALVSGDVTWESIEREVHELIAV